MPTHLVYTFKMTSASSSSARSLFAESKQRLAERVQVNMNNIASLTRQIQRGSKSNEVSISMMTIVLSNFKKSQAKLFYL